MHPTDRRQKPPPCEPGWVYVLTWPDFPGCCKIGGTNRTPTHRALELQIEYRTTRAFIIVARHAAADWWTVEQTAHRMLSDRRLPRSELFRCSPAEASHVIAAASQAYARPFAPAAWLRRMLFPPPPAYPAARSSAHPWQSGRRRWRRRKPVRVLVLLFVLIVLWLAVRHASSPGELVPLRAGAAGAGKRVRVIYPQGRSHNKKIWNHRCTQMNTDSAVRRDRSGVLSAEGNILLHPALNAATRLRDDPLGIICVHLCASVVPFC